MKRASGDGSRRALWVRPLLGLLALAMGAVTSVASVSLHNAGWGWWLWSLAAPLAMVFALPAGWSRAGFGVGWVAVVLVAILGRPEGDYVVSATARGYGLMLVAFAIVVGAIATLPVARRRPRPRPAAREESASPPPGT